MNVCILTNDRLTGLFMAATANGAGLHSTKGQHSESGFLTRVSEQQPQFALLTDKHISQPALFNSIRHQCPNTQIVLCMTENATIPNQLRSLLGGLDIDALCLITELADRLRTMLGGGFYESVLLTALSMVPTTKPFAGWHDLTKTEKTVLGWMAHEKNGPQIADLMFISPKTVNNHKTSIARKLDVHGGPGCLTKFALLNHEWLLQLLAEANRRISDR